MKRVALIILWLCPGTLFAADRTVCASGCTHTTVQAAVNAAAYGDNILIEAGTTFTEELSFPNKGAGSSYITLTTSANPASLPPEGNRTNPSYASLMPKLKSPGGGAPAVTFALGAHHYKFVHVHFLHVPHGFGEMMRIGDAGVVTKARTDQPTDIIVDRSYFQGDAVDGQKRGIALNGGRIEIKNSYFVNMVAIGQDSQCMGGWNGTGPYLIENNYCSAGTENIMFGGADPLSRLRLTPTGSITSTSTNVSVTEGGHTLAELLVGDRVAIDVSAGGGVFLEFRTITNISGSGTTGTITWSPALDFGVPDTTAGSIRFDTIANDVTIRNNYLTKELTWRDYILAPPASPAAAAAAGGTLSGTFFYKVGAEAEGQQQITTRSPLSSEVSATASGGNGTINVTCSTVTGADYYVFWRGTSSGAQNQFVVSGTCSLADNGSVSWNSGTPAGVTKWSIKNLFEFKSVTNGTVSGNIFEHLWEDTGSGARLAWWIKAENQNDNGGCWSCRTENVVFENNIIRKTFGWFQAIGRYAVNGSPIVPPDFLRNITIRNNLVYDCNGSPGPTGWGNNTSTFETLVGDTINLTVDHNTVICPFMHSAITIIQEAIDFETNLKYTNNLMYRGFFGIRCFSEGTAALNECSDDTYTVTANAFADANCAIYPSGNQCPTTAELQAAFENFQANGVGADFNIKSGHAYENAGTDGKDLGADIAAVLAATATTTTGLPSAPSPPRLPVRIRIRTP